MTRYLYYWLLRLHPPEFRRRYAEEMRWIFEEARQTRGHYALFGDALLSLIRQWAFRPRPPCKTQVPPPPQAAGVPLFQVLEESRLSPSFLMRGALMSIASFAAAAFMITHGGPSGLVRLPRVVIASSNAPLPATSEGQSAAAQQGPRGSLPQAGAEPVAVMAAAPTGEPVVIGERLVIQSRVLNEPRPLMIAKPARYDEEADAYPVLYLLDGDTHFHHTSGIVSFLAETKRAPEMLVVAVPNTNRNRDLTPPTQAELDLRFAPIHGGAEVFLRFFSDELIPFVERSYRTRPYRILVGHSFGGLFAINALTKRPNLFNAYIAIDPSLHWNDQKLVAQADAFFQETTELEADLYITAAWGGGKVLGGVRKLAGVLEEKAPAGFRWNVRYMPEEDHISIPHRATYLALDTIFAGWHLANPVELYDKGGLAAVHRHFEEGGKRFGYERKTSAFEGIADRARLDASGSFGGSRRSAIRRL